MATTKHWAYRGRGINYVRRAGSNEPFRPMGNCSSAVFAAATEKQTQPNYMTASGGNIASEESISDMTLALTLLNLSPENVALAFRGTVYDQVADEVTDEEQLAYKGALVPFDFQPDLTKPITVKDEAGTEAYTVNEDYQLTPAGILIIDGGGIADASTITLSYTKSLASVVQALTEAGQEYEFIFDGLNAADSGKASTVRAWKIKFSPTQDWGLITTDGFAELQIEAEVLPDLSKTGVVSQYFQATLQK